MPRGKKTTKEDRIWIDAIKEAHPYMQEESIRVYRAKQKCTFYDVYNDYRERMEILSRAQDEFVDFKPSTLMKFKEFQGKLPATAAHFITNVYASRKSIPAWSFINRIRNILEELDEKRTKTTTSSI